MRKRKIPANLLRSLQSAAQPGSRLLLVSGMAFLICGKDHQHIKDTTYDALIEKGWITAPRQIESDLAESHVTPAGYAIVAAVEAQKHKYHQLELHFELSELFVA